VDDGTDEAAGKQYPRPPLTRWAALLALSIALTGLLELLAVPAAMLLGPMLAGIVLAMRGKTVTVPRPCFLASQAVIGCLIARYFEPGLLATLANDWPVFVGVTFAVFAASFVLGYLLMRSGAVPGTAAIWGSAPGGAAPMVILADAYGADARLVAVITYMRVLTVVVVASVLLVFVGDGHTAPDRSVALWQGFDLAALGVTLLVVLASVVAGLVLRIPAGPMISAQPVMLLKMPRARARSSRPNVPLRIAIASGITSAAPAPCSARAAISAVALLASAQAADATTNRPIPAANMRRRPKRSPSAAPVSSSTAKVRLKALTVHCSVSTALPKSARMVAKAVVMIMASSAIMKDASAVTPSTQFFSARLVGVCIALSPYVAPPGRGAFCG